MFLSSILFKFYIHSNLSNIRFSNFEAFIPVPTLSFSISWFLLFIIQPDAFLKTYIVHLRCMSLLNSFYLSMFLQFPHLCSVHDLQLIRLSNINILLLKSCPKLISYMSQKIHIALFAILTDSITCAFVVLDLVKVTQLLKFINFIHARTHSLSFFFLQTLTFLTSQQYPSFSYGVL